MGDKEIGKIDVSVSKEANTTIYRVNSNTSVSMLFTINYTSQLEAVYRDGKLLGASSTSFQNGKKKDDSMVAKDGSGYHFRGNGKELHYRAPIYYSVAMLYFQEPVGLDKVYSETHGTFRKLVKSGNHTYKLVLPDGNENYYYYSNAQLQKVMVDRAAYDLSFHLIPTK